MINNEKQNIKDAMAEIKVILNKYDIGAHIFFLGKDVATKNLFFPKWSTIQIDDKGRTIFKGTLKDRENLVNTFGLFHYLIHHAVDLVEFSKGTLKEMKEKLEEVTGAKVVDEDITPDNHLH